MVAGFFLGVLATFGVSLVVSAFLLGGAMRRARRDELDAVWNRVRATIKVQERTRKLVHVVPLNRFVRELAQMSADIVGSN